MTVIRWRRPGITAATKLPAEPPTVAYLAERARLGFPSLAEALLERCPWCEARAGEPCRVRATGRRVAHPHEARIHAAEAKP
jgi:hypothetical protein